MSPDVDTVLLARMQFAFTIAFHIVFPSFTIGLAAFIATLEVMWVRTGREHFIRLARFWTKVFAVSFAMGVVSGIMMSYQFGTNWSRFSEIAGNVVAPLIGYEVLTAFFLEATFLGILLFGFDRVPRWLHVTAAILVAVGTSLSAFWILAANSWMQTPAGHVIRDGVVYPADWLEVIFNPSFPYRLLHMLTACYLTTSLVVLATGARYLLAGRFEDEAKTMVRMGLGMVAAAGAAAARDRRPARAQHGQASAGEDRGDGGALGRHPACRTAALRLAGCARREEPCGDRHPSSRKPDHHARSGRSVSPASRSSRARTGRPSFPCSSPSASWWASAW